MTRNTKEVAIIQIRSGKLAQIPEALNQSEFGLAYDANRLFIGNPSNEELANRVEFPWKNLEVLTEYSNLKDYYKYSYQNNINEIPGAEEPISRTQLREYLPIVSTCGTYTVPSQQTSITINNHPVVIPANATIYQTIQAINAESTVTHVYATTLNGLSSPAITFVALTNELKIENADFIHYTESDEYNISMPERKLDEKMDDNLHITDFGIKGNSEIKSNEIFTCLAEVYRKFNDNQFYRDVFFPAGEYKYAVEPAQGNNDDVNVITPFPIMSNLYVKGEGIDRTVISASGFGGISLLETVDDALIFGNASNETFGNAGYPKNVVIENMTFDSSSSNILCDLISCSNVTFNNVRFVGGNSATTSLIQISGVDANHYSNEITFNNCIFEKAKNAIIITEFVKNVSINNCTFDTISEKAVKIGSDDSSASNVYGINLDTNIFTNIGNGQTIDYVIWLGRTASYVSIHQSTFDKEVVEQTGNQLPYRDYEANDRKNFIDTLDPNTDPKKLLKFHFTQPEWAFINYLVNPDDGKTTFTVNGKNLIDAANGIDVTLDDNKVNITAVKNGDVSVNLANGNNLILGETNDEDMIWKPETQYHTDDTIFYHGYVWTALEDHISGEDFDETYWQKGLSASQIIIKRVLQLNDNIISNSEGQNPIVIKPAPNTEIMVDDSDNDPDKPYESIIFNNDKALTTVGYVKKMIQDSITKHISYEDFDIEEYKDNGYVMPIHTFSSDLYGDNIHIIRVTVNVRNPFYRLYNGLNYNTAKAVDYLGPQTHDEETDSYTYYRGDLVKGTISGDVRYGVVMKTHVAESSSIDGNPNVYLLPEIPAPESHWINIPAPIDQVEVLGSTEGKMAYLTRTYSEQFDYEPGHYKTEMPNIAKSNKFGYNDVPELDPTTLYGKSNKITAWDGRNYIVLEAEPEEEGQPETTYTMTPEKLHNTELATRMYDEGYVYVYDEDSNFTIDGNHVNLMYENPYSLNYSNGTIYLKFHSTQCATSDLSPEERTGRDAVSDKYLILKEQLSPAGDMIVRIDFIRQEV